MNVSYRKTVIYLLLGVLWPVSASCRENGVRFGYKEMQDTKQGKILVFDLNPLNWMFGVRGGWAVDNAVEKVTWGTNAYQLDADFGDGWSSIELSGNRVPYKRVQLYHNAGRDAAYTVGFSAADLSNAILEACFLRKLDSCRLRIKYRLSTKSISPADNKFEQGPELESDWILVEVRKSVVYLIGYWETEGYRGYLSTAGHDDDHEATLNPPVVLGPAERK